MPWTWAAVICVMKFMLASLDTWNVIASRPMFQAQRLSDSAALLNGRDDAVKFWMGARNVRRPSRPLPEPVALRSRVQVGFAACHVAFAASMAGKTVVEPSS